MTIIKRRKPNEISGNVLNKQYEIPSNSIEVTMYFEILNPKK